MLNPAKLELARENLATRLDDLLELLSTIRRKEVQAATIAQITTHYRQLAIACLLLEADTDAFFRLAAASGLAHASMLDHVAWDSLVDLQYICTSAALPFFDSIVAGDLSTAATIASNSCAVWATEDEAEDDFLRMRLLMALLSPERNGLGAVSAMRDRVLRLVDPTENPRVALALALHARDDEAFERGMTELTASLDAEWTEERTNPNRDPEQELTESHVSMEALALVRLARHVGIPTGGEYLLVPGLALVPPPPPTTYPPDLWKRGV